MLDSGPGWAEEKYPDLIRRISGVFRHNGGEIKLGKNCKSGDLARCIRNNINGVEWATGSKSREEQERIIGSVLRCLEAGGKISFRKARKSWSAERNWMKSNLSQSCKIATERKRRQRQGAKPKPRMPKSSWSRSRAPFQRAS